MASPVHRILSGVRLQSGLVGNAFHRCLRYKDPHNHEPIKSLLDATLMHIYLFDRFEVTEIHHFQLAM